MEFNKEKIKQVIHYIIHKCQNQPYFGKTVLYKLMYFSDFNYYEKYEKLITNEKYVKKHHGPTPSNFEELINELINENKIGEKTEQVYTHYRHKYYSSKNPDDSLLNNKELEVINNVINELSHMNAKKISEYSHGDKPWRVAKFRDVLDPEFVFYRTDEYSVREYDE